MSEGEQMTRSKGRRGCIEKNRRRKQEFKGRRKKKRREWKMNIDGSLIIIIDRLRFWHKLKRIDARSKRRS